MATELCPQCKKPDAPTYSNGVFVTHRDESGAVCLGSLNHPKDLPLVANQKPPAHFVPGMHAEFNP